MIQWSPLGRPKKENDTAGFGLEFTLNGVAAGLGTRFVHGRPPK